ncbi:phosphoadenosine phosphosulfate reductase family protein [Infirmifilum sp.]|uniref:phosphoadenosine phosphosulfate reductase family protein n=1 Tax=Infirmifilum sp. TaxID=2856575 RepID=UPI003D0BBB76
MPSVDLLEFIKEYSIERVLCSFSGGRDSLVACHLSWMALKGSGVPFEVVFVDTGVGLPVVRQYVEQVSELIGWRLVVVAPKANFFEVASKWGMPTPRRRWCCRLLKLQPLLDYATSLGASTVLFITGLRRLESKRRRRIKGYYYRHHQGVHIYYVDPIVDWSDKDVEEYIRKHGLPVNPVSKLIGFSGECFCGVYTKLDHLVKVARNWPDFIERFKVLEERWKEGKFKGKRYKVFYAEGVKLSVDELLELANREG